MSKSKTKEKTLYCSFCGKSQHDIRTLVAGPMVFICNECSDLVDEIVWSETGSKEFKNGIRIRITSSHIDIEDALASTLVDAISRQLPDYEINYVFTRRDVSNNNKYLSLIAGKRDGTALNTEEQVALKSELQKMALQLSAVSTKFLYESKKRRQVEEELNELKSEYLSILRKELNHKYGGGELKAVMFMDISGFSTLTDGQRCEVVDLLRGMIGPLLIDKGATEINTWGDAIVCTFDDHEQAVKLSARFIRHLAVEQHECRIGMAWGEVRTKFNKAINRNDIDGAVVNLAARLEPLAPMGRVLLSSDFGGLEYSDPSIKLVPYKARLKKGFGKLEAGDELDTFLLDIQKN